MIPGIRDNSLRTLQEHGYNPSTKEEAFRDAALFLQQPRGSMLVQVFLTGQGDVVEV